jgi:hypothetical protein
MFNANVNWNIVMTVRVGILLQNLNAVFIFAILNTNIMKKCVTLELQALME